MKRNILTVTFILLIGFCIYCLLLIPSFSKSDFKYKKSQTISLNGFLYADEAPENWNNLSINENGDVIYRGKVILNDEKKPINEDTSSNSYLLLKIYIVANGAVPKENCDASDFKKNGIYGLGCYIYSSKNKD